ncbi:MAG: hypothetical protein PHF51_04630 [Candidatus ainarchaeum sp.]|nr:hypothetical protein [Candidatus ainarchaeum sp.]
MPALDLPFLKKRAEPQKQATEAGEAKARECEDCAHLKRKAALYLKIIERYKGYIEASEDKSITELRALVVPEDPAVRKIVEEIKSGFRPYIYDRDFPKAAEKAYLFCRNELASEFLPVEFWLSPSDIAELRLSDEIDKAILLCSILLALENASAKVVVETQERLRHAFVTFERDGVFHLLDPVHGANLSGARDEVIKKAIRQPERKVVYEFNNSEYNEW